MSVPAPSRVSSAASPACSTMNRRRLALARQRSQAVVKRRAKAHRNAVAAIARHRRTRPVGRQIELIGKTLPGPPSRTQAGGRSRCPGRPRRRAPRTATACSRHTAPAAAAGRAPARCSAPDRRPQDRAPAAPATSRRPRCGAARSSSTCSRAPSDEQLRPQRQLAREIEALPRRGGERRAELRLGHRRPTASRGRAARRRQRSAAAASPRRRGTGCAGSRGAPPHRRARPPAPPRRAPRSAAARSGSCRSGSVLPAGRGTTAGAARTTAGSRPGAPRHQRARRAAPRRRRRARASAGDRRRFEQAADRQLGVQRGANAADQPDRQQRVAAEREEVVDRMPTRVAPSTSANSLRRASPLSASRGATVRRGRRLAARRGQAPCGRPCRWGSAAARPARRRAAGTM